MHSDQNCALLAAMTQSIALFAAERSVRRVALLLFALLTVSLSAQGANPYDKPRPATIDKQIIIFPDFVVVEQ
ncbi:MAG: hypothetical protein WBD67_03715, partial [Terracidiphilus sp.]